MHHIPNEVQLNGRYWKDGDEVSCVTEKGSWQIGIVLNNGRPRLSAGWNKFAMENDLNESQILVFSMAEENEGIVFNIQL